MRNPLHFAIESHFQVRLLWTLHYLQPIYFSTLSFVDSQRTFVAWEWVCSYFAIGFLLKFSLPCSDFLMRYFVPLFYLLFWCSFDLIHPTSEFMDRWVKWGLYGLTLLLFFVLCFSHLSPFLVPVHGVLYFPHLCSWERWDTEDTFLAVNGLLLSHRPWSYKIICYEFVTVAPREWMCLIWWCWRWFKEKNALTAISQCLE